MNSKFQRGDKKAGHVSYKTFHWLKAEVETLLMMLALVIISAFLIAKSIMFLKFWKMINPNQVLGPNGIIP